MSLSENDLFKIKELISEEFKSYHCRLNIPAEAKEHMGHIFGVVVDLGDGDAGKGAEITRDNHKFLHSLRKRIDKANTLVFMIVITSVVGGALSALWLGVKQLGGTK